MSGVFANGLEISGKSTQGKTIAAFPDVCFTPPENPATPPGVPVPYPSFGMASDTDKGTGTVKIKGETVNIKNQSFLSKSSGTEAGCAAKKGIITSKNTGKEYFNSWSPNVKFDGEPVIRFTDLATNNHMSPPGNTPPWVHVLTADFGDSNCGKILADVGLQLHAHKDSPCTSPDQSEHMCQNAFFQNKRGGPAGSIPGFGKYSAYEAPCICMEGPGHAGANSPHGRKTSAQLAFAKSLTSRPTVEQAVGSETQNIRANHPAFAPAEGPMTEKQSWALECLEAVIYAYLESASDPTKSGDALKQSQARVPWGDKIPAPTSGPGGAI
jgi:hypothetical protein